MRLIRKLELQKQKHTKKKKKSCSGRGASGSTAQSRGSVFRTHNRGQERAQLLLSGSRRIGPEGAGSGPVSTPARSPSGPSSSQRGCQCAGRLETRLGSALLILLLAALLSPRRQKVDDSSRPGHSQDGGEGLGSERSR
jgi:hypothetical protein